ncbi:hypothetical protein KC19_11G135400 [Ceratodon purpureus]|uniref:Uncharacterized protein n=1 Tax=Ceratodon purpureus TaxID=3225 RepID=A0A8T0GH55_CERPU|nr:hypothetical protein KC19_11G135400 [Ceratodon purpureus]
MHCVRCLQLGVLLAWIVRRIWGHNSVVRLQISMKLRTIYCKPWRLSPAHCCHCQS